MGKKECHVIETGLEPGHYDNDFLLEYLMVKLLVDFVELEKPFEHFDTEVSDNHEEWVQLKELYEFFKANDFEALEYDALTEKLVQLVKVRGLMWT